jgi:hypothetical protein
MNTEAQHRATHGGYGQHYKWFLMNEAGRIQEIPVGTNGEGKPGQPSVGGQSFLPPRNAKAFRDYVKQLRDFAARQRALAEKEKREGAYFDTFRFNRRLIALRYEAAASIFEQAPEVTTLMLWGPSSLSRYDPTTGNVTVGGAVVGNVGNDGSSPSTQPGGINAPSTPTAPSKLGVVVVLVAIGSLAFLFRRTP